MQHYGAWLLPNRQLGPNPDDNETRRSSPGKSDCGQVRCGIGPDFYEYGTEWFQDGLLYF